MSSGPLKLPEINTGRLRSSSHDTKKGRWEDQIEHALFRTTTWGPGGRSRDQQLPPRNDTPDDIPLSKPIKSQPEVANRWYSKSGIIAWWLPELWASLASVVSFSCIVAILRVNDGRGATAIRASLPLTLTLNGLIAIIATINRACLTIPVYSGLMQEMWLHFASEAKKETSNSRLKDIDLYTEASRGSWGSLVLLFSLRRPRFLTWLGCLITILALTYSTFAQQLIEFDSLPAKGFTPVGNIPRAEWVDPAALRQENDGPLVPPIWTAAVYEGMLSKSIPPPELSCQSISCSWPLTPSLAVCGSCQRSTFDITGQGSSNTKNVDNPYPETYCNYTLPSGSEVSYLRLNDSSSSSTCTDPKDRSFYSIAGNGSIFPRNATDRMYLANLEFFGTWYNQSSTALTNTECALWFCVNVYQIYVESVAQEQDVFASYDTLDDTLGIPIPPSKMPSYDPANQTRFVPSPTLQKIITPFLAAVLTNNASFIGSERRHSTNDLIYPIWQAVSADPERWIAALAASLSNAVRTTSPSVRDQYNGTVIELTLVVQWAWLAFPASLMALSMFYLGLVIADTARHPQVASWKGSALALLAFGVDDGTRRAACEREGERKGIWDAVGGKKVRFARDEGGDAGWKFKTL